MTRMTGAQAAVRTLLEHGVDTVFGIPGIQLDPLFDAFYEQRNRLRVVHTRHEQGAAFMAMGYAQSSRKTGVYAVVPGPGLLNSLTALATAASANLPVLALTGQIPSYQIGRGFGIPHELKDQLAVARGVVDWVERANHPAEVPGLLADAFRVMHAGRRRPAVLEVAPDVLALSAPVPDSHRDSHRDSHPDSVPDWVLGGAGRAVTALPIADEEQLTRALQALGAARRPLLLAGGGVLGAEAALARLAERLQAPVVMSANALGALPEGHPLAYDMLSGQALWQKADLALAVGTRLVSPALAWGREGELPVLRIDVDPVQIAKPREAQVSIVADAGEALAALDAGLAGRALPAESPGVWAAPVRADMQSQLAALEPLSGLVRAVRAALPRNGVLVCDVTRFAVFARFGFPVYEPRTFLLPGYQATLGWAYPAALGAKVANPDRPVVAVCGDGGFMFTVQELATARQHGIAVVAVIVNNAAYGNVKTIQASSYGGRHIAVDLENPDFVALAESFGIAGRRAATPQALEAALRELLAAQQPGVIEVPVGELPNVWSLVKRPPSQGRVRD